MDLKEKIRLTQYSHGAGCGCKLSPAVLDSILSKVGKQGPNQMLLVGNDSKDDAAVMDLGDGTAIVSTTDFFMPIVDDPFSFGRIAATNAGDVLEGGRAICEEAGIPLAGGHSIDCPEPIFGLAVTGRVSISELKKNGGAKEGDTLFITKALGVGMITTAQKKSLATDEDVAIAVESMQTLNKIGQDLAKIAGVNAMTDVTGFGLLGHLVEMCQGANLSAEIYANKIPQLIPGKLEKYHAEGAVPGGTKRNFDSYGHHVSMEQGFLRDLLCDPQTSGGLLVSVSAESVEEVVSLGTSKGLNLTPIGKILSAQQTLITVL
jgi:selenide,water dikinase